MERDARHHQSNRSLTTGASEPLIGVLTQEDGQPVVRYFAGESDAASAPSSDETLAAALAVIGAWSDLDWDEFSGELDRIRHMSTPTPPIEL